MGRWPLVGEVEDKSWDWEEVEVGSSQVALEKWCVPEERSGECSTAQHSGAVECRQCAGGCSTSNRFYRPRSGGQRARTRNPTEEQAQPSWAGWGVVKAAGPGM